MWLLTRDYIITLFMQATLPFGTMRRNSCIWFLYVSHPTRTQLHGMLSRHLTGSITPVIAIIHVLCEMSSLYPDTYGFHGDCYHILRVSLLYPSSPLTTKYIDSMINLFSDSNVCFIPFELYKKNEIKLGIIKSYNNFHLN